MIITRHNRRQPASRSKSDRGFTLVEVMIGGALGSMLLLAVTTAFLMMGRSQANAANYVTMEQQARRGLERFSQDVRMATGITWASTTDVTLNVIHVTDDATDAIRYYYDSNSASSTYKCFLRYGADPVTAVVGTQVLIRNVDSFEFARWTLGSSTVAATSDALTKQLQIRLTVRTTSTTVATATNLVVSARYLLRNK